MNSVQAATLALSAIAILISFANLFTARAGRLQARTNLLVQLRKEWANLQPSWRVCLALVRGSNDYYADLSSEEATHLKPLFDAIHLEGADPDSLWYAEARLRQDVLLVREFLSLCAHSLIAGDLRSRDLYAFLGPEVARHGRVVRALYVEDGYRYAELQAMPDGGYGIHLKTLALVDLLWAEMARNCDLASSSILSVAAHKRESGSGLQCRRRVIGLMVREGSVVGVARGLAAAWRLMYAEYVAPIVTESRPSSELDSFAIDGKLRRLVATRRARLSRFVRALPSMLFIRGRWLT